MYDIEEDPSTTLDGVKSTGGKLEICDHESN